MWRKGCLIILQICILFIFSYIGTLIQTILHLKIPGSIIGLLLLFGLLYFHVIPEKWIKQGANVMTNHLILFFIPATVGIMNYFQLFIGKGIWLIIVTAISTFCVLALSGLVSDRLAIRKDSNHA